MEIVRGRLSAADFSNPAMRYNPDDNIIEYSPDGGETWLPNEGADPRSAPSYRYPVLATADPRCDAAANMVKWIKDFVDDIIAQLNGGASTLQLANNFLTTFATLFPPALLLLLLQEFASSVFDTGATALDAAFTTAQYDLLLCAFRCNIEPDGSVTEDDFLRIGAAITATMDTLPALVVAEIMYIQGIVGLSNAGTLGGETGDCSDCDCEWCFNFDFSVDTYAFVPIVDGGRPLSVFVGGEFRSILANYCAAFGDNAMYNNFGRLMPAINLTSVEVYGNSYYYDPSSIVTPNIQLMQNGSAFATFAPTGAFKQVWTGSMVQTGFWSFRLGGVLGYRHCAAGSAIGAGNISRMVWRGIGINPFGGDNC